MMYVTDQSTYFYSPFNSKTFIGLGSKIHLPYSAIKTIKKESKLVIFKTSIRFVLKSGQELVFSNFLSRDTCFSMILNCVRTREIISLRNQELAPVAEISY
jgi:hypothetical protein